MTGAVITQLGVGGCICFIVIKECFSVVMIFVSKKNGQCTQQVTEKFCDERTERIESKIDAGNAVIAEQMKSIQIEINTGFKKLNGGS